MNIPPDQTTDLARDAWNQAHDRLRDFLATFALADHAQVSRLTLKLLDEARELHRQKPDVEPVVLVMVQTQKRMGEWLASNLEGRNHPRAEAFAEAYVALLLSRAFQAAPDTFLVSPLPANLKESIRRALLVTGPDLQISSMTPRHLDYGPMLDLAKRTWHRWNSREIILAVLFWTGVYFIFYSVLSEVL